LRRGTQVRFLWGTYAIRSVYLYQWCEVVGEFCSGFLHSP
jgi:hypothetical protein